MSVTGSFGLPSNGRSRWAILVHGGAGDVADDRISEHREGCRLAAEAGAAVLRAGGSALDAAQRAVEVLEDDPRFNAGTGACLNEAGLVELDAAIMEGRALRAGSVAALSAFRHPIAIARAVLEDGRHVMYAAEGAARFARAHGFEPARQEEMITQAARRKWEEVRDGIGDAGWAGGTVGAVVRDASGLVVAATSTGGMTNKRIGRVGDTPIIGAGTYAEDEAGAASCTGHGEGFIRTCLARAAVDRMRSGLSPEEAARQALSHMHAKIGVTGGIILVDSRGDLGLARTTRTMSWGACYEGGDSLTGA